MASPCGNMRKTANVLLRFKINPKTLRYKQKHDLGSTIYTVDFTVF